MQNLPYRRQFNGTACLTTWVVFTVLCIVLSWGLPATAQTSSDEDSLGAGTLYFSSASSQAVQAPRLHTRVHMDVAGIVARVEVTQRFQNTSDHWVEGLYAFPLPENCAVDRLRMQVGARTIVGEVREKIAAEQLYEQARANGQRASLVQQHRPNLFRTAVANIAPGEAIDITIGYLQIVTQQDGRYSLRFPLTITPRYLPGASADQVLTTETSLASVSQVSATPSDSATLGDLQQPLTQPDERFQSVSFDIRLATGTAIDNIVSTYHRVRVADLGGAYEVQLTDGRVAPDHDFELAWTPVIHGEPAATLFHERTEQGDHMLLMLLPPHEKVQLATPREVIFIIDTSGSMGGESIEQARAALLKALDTLTPADKFNIIQFNSSYESSFTTTVPADLANLRRARAYVLGLRATGGTEMLPALTAAMNTPVSGEYLRQIIFMTDGAVGNEDELLRTIQQRLGNARLFTIGIGAAPNGFFMRKVAQLGRGTFTYIGAISEVDARVSELIQKIERPVLTNITLQWPTGVEAEMAPERIGDLYSGEPLVLTARTAVEARGTLTVSGVSSTHWSRQLALGAGRSQQGISTLWARSKIEDLMDQQVEQPEEAKIREQVLPLALSYGLVTRYTSLVAIDHTPARSPEDVLESERVPNTSPQGSEWSIVAYPKTATPAQLQLLIGVLALLLAGLLARHK